MDAFVTKKTPRADPKCGEKTTAKDRQKQFAKETFETGGKLFCAACNVVLDHTRRSSVASHMLSAKHKKRSQEAETSGQPAKRQRVLTVGPATVASEERNELCMEWVSMLAAANIPLSKTDHPAVREFLKKRVVNGGSIPHAKQLQKCYLRRETDRRVEELNLVIKGKPVSIMTDEMSDDNGRFVLNILAAPLEVTEDKVKSYLLDTVFLECTNHSTVAQAVVNCVTKCGINFNDVMVVNTDNATYMKKAYETVFKGLFPNSVHITCLAHVMNLLGEEFRKPFKPVNKFVKNFNALFWHAGARKARFLRHLKAVRPEKRAKMPPNPIGTRWNCWYDAVNYHIDHIDTYGEFIKAEMDHARSLAPNSLKDLNELFGSETDLKLVKAQMLFFKDKSEEFVRATDLFQSQSPMAMSVWPMLQNLQCLFDYGGISSTQAERYFPEDLDKGSKMVLHDVFNQAYALVSAKIEKYLTADGQPGIEFLEHVQFFHPSKLMFLPPASNLTGIPELHSVPESEVLRYKKYLGPDAVKQAPTSALDIVQFWNSVQETVPSLARCAKRYMLATVTSADVERSFSLYNLVLSQRRRSLSEDTLRCLIFFVF